MNPGKPLPFAVDCRTVDMNGYRQLYSIVMTYFVFQLALLNPRIQEQLFDELRSVCGESPERERLLARLRRVQALLPTQDTGHPVESEDTWQELKPILKARNEPLDWLLFTIFASDILNTVIRGLKRYEL
jgi:hypothetical protein